MADWGEQFEVVGTAPKPGVAAAEFGGTAPQPGVAAAEFGGAPAQPTPWGEQFERVETPQITPEVGRFLYQHPRRGGDIHKATPETLEAMRQWPDRAEELLDADTWERRLTTNADYYLHEASDKELKSMPEAFREEFGKRRTAAREAAKTGKVKARDLLENLGSRRYVLDVWRNAPPEEKDAILKAAPEAARKLATESTGAVSRTLGALATGVSQGVSQPIMELIGAGGTEEEIEVIRYLTSVGSEHFGTKRPDDAWYESGPLQAVEMVPWMLSVIGSGGAARGAAKAAGLGAKGTGRAGLAGVTAATYPGAYAGTKDAFNEAGVDGPWAKPGAALLAVGIGMVEGIIPNPFVGKVPLTQGAKKAALAYVKEAAKRAPIEASEEYIQGWVTGLGRTVATHLDAEAPDQGFGEAFMEGWDQGNDALLPLAFMMGAPASVGAGVTALQAKKVTAERERLQAMVDKGFVSKDDGRSGGLTDEEMASRSTRKEAFKRRVDILTEMEGAQTDATEVQDEVQEPAPQAPSEGQIEQQAEVPVEAADPQSQILSPEQIEAELEEAEGLPAPPVVQDQGSLLTPEQVAAELEQAPAETEPVPSPKKSRGRKDQGKPVDKPTGDSVAGTDVQGDKPVVDRDAIREQFRKQMAEKRGKPKETGRTVPEDAEEQDEDDIFRMTGDEAQNILDLEEAERRSRLEMEAEADPKPEKSKGRTVKEATPDFRSRSRELMGRDHVLTEDESGEMAGLLEQAHKKLKAGEFKDFLTENNIPLGSNPSKKGRLQTAKDFVSKLGTTAVQADVIKGKLDPAPSDTVTGTSDQVSEAEKGIQKAQERADKAGKALGKAIRELGSGEKPGMNPADPAFIRLVVDYAVAQTDLNVRKFKEFVLNFRDTYGADETRKASVAIEEGWGALPEFDIDVDEAGSVEDVLAEADKAIPSEGQTEESIPPDGDGLTSIKNEVVNELREKRGVAPLPEVAADTREEWMDAAADRIAETNGTIGPSLVAEINKKQRNLSNIEVAVLQTYYRAVNNAFESAASELTEAMDSGNSVSAAVAQANADNLLAELATIEDATKKAGREWGRAGVARQIMLERDFSMGAMASRARVANAGQPLTAKETAEITGMSKRIEALQEKLKESESKREDLERNRRVDAEIEKTEKRARRKTVLKKSTRRQKAQAKVDSAWKEFSNLAKGKIYSNPLELAIPAVKVTAAYVELGVVSFSELMAEVGKKIGRANAAKAEDVFRTAWDDMKAKGDIVAPEIDQTNAGAISRLAKRIERTIVESGMTERDEVVDAVHDALTEILPELITRRETMDAMSGYGQFTPLSKDEIDQTIRDINGQLQQLGKLDDMEKGKSPAKTGPERRKPSDEERRLIRQVNDARERGGFATTNAYEANLKRRLAEYQQRIVDGEFEAKPKKGPRELSREELDLKLKLEDVKQEFFNKVAEYRISKLVGLDRTIDYARETAHLSRAAMTSFDLSAAFRQGGAVVFGHPVMGLKAGHKMIQALVSRQAEFDSIEEIRNRPNGQLYETARLAITEQEGKVTRQEEAFMGRWGKKFGPIRASARAYTTFLNNARADMFDSLVENLGRSGAVTLDESKVIAQFVNAATGRADLGKFNSAAANMNTVFFAPRYVASRFQYLATPFLLPGMKTSGRVKKAIAIEYARHATGLATFMGLVVALGSLVADDDDDAPAVELDPRSSDFGKIKIGDTRIDPLSGLSQVTVLLSRLATGQKKNSRGEIRALRGEDRRYADDTTTSVIGRFLRSKLAPVPGSAVDLLQGENVVGEEATTASVAVDLFTPLSFREVKDTMVSRGIAEGTAISILALLGMGTATYGPRTDYITGDAAERQEQFAKDLKRMQWDTPDPAYSELLTEAQREQVRVRREERKQTIVVDATHDPDRGKHKSDETFQESLDRRETNRETLKETGWSHIDAQKLLIDSFKGTKSGNKYWDKVTALGELYGMDKETAKTDMMGKSVGRKRPAVTEFDQWVAEQQDRWREEKKKAKK